MNDDTDLQDLLRSEDGDPGCDAGIGIFEAYIELELAGKDPAARYPSTAVHLRTCTACRIDHDGLLDAARQFGDVTPP